MEERIKVIQQLESFNDTILLADDEDLLNKIMKYGDKDSIHETIYCLHLLKLAYLKLDLIISLSEGECKNSPIEIKYRDYRRKYKLMDDDNTVQTKIKKEKAI